MMPTPGVRDLESANEPLLERYGTESAMQWRLS